MATKSAAQYFYESHARKADGMKTFIEIAPTLTAAEFETLCVKRPEVYEKFRAYFYATKEG